MFHSSNIIDHHNVKAEESAFRKATGKEMAGNEGTKSNCIDIGQCDYTSPMANSAAQAAVPVATATTAAATGVDKVDIAEISEGDQKMVR